MSAGPRLPLDLAQRAASALMAIWEMKEPDCMVVGSVRRGRPDVGDVEFIAPATSPLMDRLYGNILHSIVNEKRGEAIKGLKPGFLYCSLRMKLVNRDTGEQVEIPVEIHRYTPENRGWIQTMRTGPSEFGQQFLAWWKQTHAIPQTSKASIDGHLVDAKGELARCQGFPDSYILTGTQSNQVAKIGNSVPPQMVEALIRANLPEACA